jgi:hypothetical protein
VTENTESLDHALGQVAKLGYLTVLTLDPFHGCNVVIYADGEKPRRQRQQPSAGGQRSRR